VKEFYGLYTAEFIMPNGTYEVHSHYPNEFNTLMDGIIQGIKMMASTANENVQLHISVNGKFSHTWSSEN
jgi:hypothetical protein